MMDATPTHPKLNPGTEHAVFDRVLCGLDATPDGLEVARQAAQLRAEGGELTVVSALDIGATAQAGWTASRAEAELRAELEGALEAARTAIENADFKLLEGRPDQVLLAEAVRSNATLVAVGTHGISRPVGIALGTVTTMILHEAPCSVLVVRERPPEAPIPRSIVVGVDGSPESAVAVEVASALAERFGIETQLWAIRDGKDFDQSAVDLISDNVRFEDGKPVEMLVGAAGPNDLLVVGSRGLHGIRALGSVSERVAHKAHCSVLVVRPPASS
jgi:nucleotide-binding universal stress UspA family protein